MVEYAIMVIDRTSSFDFDSEQVRRFVSDNMFCCKTQVFKEEFTWPMYRKIKEKKVESYEVGESKVQIFGVEKSLNQSDEMIPLQITTCTDRIHNIYDKTEGTFDSSVNTKIYYKHLLDVKIVLLLLVKEGIATETETGLAQAFEDSFGDDEVKTIGDLDEKLSNLSSNFILTYAFLLEKRPITDKRNSVDRFAGGDGSLKEYYANHKDLEIRSSTDSAEYSFDCNNEINYGDYEYVDSLLDEGSVLEPNHPRDELSLDRIEELSPAEIKAQIFTQLPEDYRPKDIETIINSYDNCTFFERIAIEIGTLIAYPEFRIFLGTKIIKIKIGFIRITITIPWIYLQYRNVKRILYASFFAGFDLNLFRKMIASCVARSAVTSVVLTVVIGGNFYIGLQIFQKSFWACFKGNLSRSIPCLLPSLAIKKSEDNWKFL